VKKKKYISSKTKGNITEKIISDWLTELGLKHIQEDTMKNTRTRSKGSVDLQGDTFALEVKYFTGSLTYRYGSNKSHKLHWDQVEYLSRTYNNGKVSGLIITSDNETFYFIHIRDFLMHWIKTKRKSINLDIASKIGVRITNSKELSEVL